MRARIKRILFYLLLFFLTFSNTNSFAKGQKSAKDWANDPIFKTGRLKDFTPSGISPTAVNVAPGEPIFLITGIDRNVLVDPRNIKDREKITFQVDSGDGYFTDFEDPTKKVNGTITVPLNVSELASVIFYPSGASGICLRKNGVKSSLYSLVRING